MENTNKEENYIESIHNFKYDKPILKTRVEISLGALIIYLFIFILLVVILLEIYYFEQKLVELTNLLNHLLLR